MQTKQLKLEAMKGLIKLQKVSREDKHSKSLANISES
jgi:hypothetical protein